MHIKEHHLNEIKIHCTDTGWNTGIGAGRCSVTVYTGTGSTVVKLIFINL